MSFALLFAALTMAGTAAAGEAASVVRVKPVAISLNRPPEVETRRSCVLYHRGGGMNVLSVTATDPAIGVELREDTEAGAYVVTATLPAGYPTTNGKKVNILVRTDLPNKPVIRIPVHVWNGPRRNDPGWLYKARSLIGSPAPATLMLERWGGGTLQIGAVEGKVTVLVFSTFWCEHCNVYVPIIERVWKDYRSNPDAVFLGVTAGSRYKRDVAEAIERWGAKGPTAVDWDFELIETYGVKAYPVVFVIGPDGIVEAVHGRLANTAADNGLDNLETELRTEIEILLAGGTRRDFPDWQAAKKPPVTTQPATVLPARPVLTIAPQNLKATCKPGASTVFKLPIRNGGLEPLKLLKVSPTEGVRIEPGYVQEVPPGGLGVLLCQVTAPVQSGPFSRRIEIKSNDSRNPIATANLTGNVVEE